MFKRYISIVINTDIMELKLVKTIVREYKLEPFGCFRIKMTKHKPKSLKTIWFNELSIDWDDSMPFTKEQEEDIIKLMKKHKTDILTDGDKFYTRLGGGKFGSLTSVYHKHLLSYKKNIGGFRDAVDDI